MKKILLITLFISINGMVIYGQTNEYREWCKTPPLSPEELYQIQDEMNWRLSQKRTFVDTNIVIPVAFHIITQLDGKGDITDAQIEAQIEELNFGFVSHGISFILYSADRIANNNWYWEMGERENEIKQALAIDPAHTMNVYSANLEGGLLGWAWYPSSWSEDSYMHGIVIHSGSFPDGWIDDYAEGDVAVHEAGHYVGLAHTFSPWNPDLGITGCEEPGDYVDDTPYEMEPTWTCDDTLDSCPQPGLDPIHNFMDYQDDACVFEFTPGQGDRALAMINTYRPGLLDAYIPPDDYDPTPPSDFSAYSDFSTPNSVTLNWMDPVALINGDTIPDFEIVISRDDSLIDYVTSGTEFFVDTELEDGRNYSYIIMTRVIKNDSVSTILAMEVFCGGSPIPSVPGDISAEVVDSTVTLTWTVPTTQADDTPLDDIAEIRIFRNGEVVAELAVSTLDTGAVMSFDDNPPFGFTYDYQINSIDNESPNNESELTEIARVWVGDVPEYLIWNPEGIGNRTANALILSFRELGLSAAEVNNLTEFGGRLYDLGYKIIFVLNGIFPDTYEIWDGDWGTQGNLFKLNYYLNDGGSIYMEAGDEFSNYNAVVLTERFNINVTDAGTSDLANIKGILGTFTRGMNFDYDGANLGIDQFESIDDAFPIFKNSSPKYYNAIAYSCSTYRTIGASFEFGGLIDGTTSKTDFLEKIIAFLVDTTSASLKPDYIPLHYALYQNYPNPFNPVTTINFNLPVNGEVKLVIYDILGREVEILVNSRLVSGEYSVNWDASNVSSGIYFYRLTSKEGIRTRKLVVLK